MGQRGKKSLKITDAIVRGSKNHYEFEVFPIETEFEPQSAVYIFSQRKTDKKGRGHQQFFCIGQTDSLDGEFSKYKKQFASKHRANVICVRIEEEAKLRSEIENELKNLYSISCSSNIEKIPAKVEKRLPPKQIAKEKESTVPKKALPNIKSQKEQTAVRTVKKSNKTVAQKNLPKEIKKSDSKKTVTKNVKNIVPKNKSIERGKKLLETLKVAKTAKSNVTKSDVSPVKVRNPKQIIKPNPIKNKTSPAVKNKKEIKNLKIVAPVSKNNKVSKPPKNQKVSDNNKASNKRVDKKIDKKGQKAAAQKSPAKGGKRTAKPASRKQLAF